MGKAIMIQGTMSDSGKSLITAGLCRYFSNKGLKVAPFKSQNMASNCYITEDGKQLGRAQAIQAVAARCKVSEKMNPILLKPKTNVGSEVIVNGKSMGFMSASDYFSYRKSLFPVVEDCFNQLLKTNDLIIIEGAGSPAEINLKADDLVNMGMAKIAKAPVLIVGDIDRGGVFASLYGTYMLLEKDEKEFVKGFIINKFRGDKTLLMPGIDMFYEKIRVKTLGVVPYIDVTIDEEDSLSKKDCIRKDACLQIAVINFKGINNFYDFMIFKEYDYITLKYADKTEDALSADLIIIPDFNTANFSDFKNNKEIAFLINTGIPTVAIGGGYEVLCSEYLSDDKIHSGLNIIKELSLYNETKCPNKVEYICNASENSFFNCLTGEKIVGFNCKNYDFIFKTYGNILCISLNSFFQNRNVTEKIIKSLLYKKGITFVKNNENYFLDNQLEILSKCIEENLDMKEIENIISEGI